MFAIVAVVYTLITAVLAIFLISRAPKKALCWFYGFCVGCLLFLLLAGIILRAALNPLLDSIVRGGAIFLYAVLPFFFIHFIVLFARKYEVLKHKLVVPAIYTVALLIYALLLFGYIAVPLTEKGEVTETGYVFFMTWLTLFFAIGLAMVYDIARGFYEKAMKGSVIYVGFLILILVLPSPFTQSMFSSFLHLKIEWYYFSSALALVGAVYLVFRQRIIGATFSDAVKLAFGSLSDMFVVLDPFLQVEMLRGMAVISTLGYKEKELVGRPFTDLFLERDALQRHHLLSTLRENGRANFDIDVKGQDGVSVPMNFSLSPYFVENKLAGFVGIGRDMTERRKLEQEVRQAQKLESVGVLAGGIAHDFNNILQIFQFNLSDLREKVANPARLDKVIQVNDQAVKRGSQLVQQILTFARKTDVKMEQVELNKFIPELLSLTSQTFPRTISFGFLPGLNVPAIQGDKNQISQIIVNLLVNARDAMPGGGQIKISTAVVEARQVAGRFPSPLDVSYVLLKVNDSGHGMDEATRKMIFEPFFTTKELGKGTGLGLSVVYGIIKTHKGFIDVESAPGVGTTFDVYFPILPTTSQAPGERKQHIQEDLRGSEPILIVEDEQDLLTGLAAAFTNHGYKVFTARDGLEAVEVFRHHFREIGLVITDLGLPVMGGWDAFMRMKEVNPSLKVIVVSGYLDPETLTEKRREGMGIVIRKPFEAYDLLHAARQVLKT